ncbi:hypothetical protein [Novosphingobium taihuense]|uniref:Vacuolar-type H+-ATPase subunit I/STV1 n=1 Tax=Novosphingobium taihuense TaxID=260085 RepID=A0A7W7A9V8_9SPHN|nr:hypothetical protein [Novosphingobium taihuense]MBB4613016.1 vacuolar-type H+-ATPase subunit I/STV1 [Novosphingobium taihuense]TWH85160.1 hypothetical protein IQ25_01914 [Novosphingobium taihuense]
MFLIVWLIVMIGYTSVVVVGLGPDFLKPFQKIVEDKGWPGQFGLDLLGFLLLTAFWIGWRHGSGLTGTTLALVVVSGGMIGVSIYLLIAIARCRGDIRSLLLGQDRARDA